jgi:hypothetical protein
MVLRRGNSQMSRKKYDQLCCFFLGILPEHT